MTNYFMRSVVTLFTLTVSISAGYSQALRDTVAGIPVNYEESLSGKYTLPDPLVFNNGKKVKNARQWYKERRPQIVSLFKEFQYGKFLMLLKIIFQSF